MPTLDSLLEFDKKGKIKKSDFKIKGKSFFVERYQLDLGLPFVLVRKNEDRTIPSIGYTSLPKKVRQTTLDGFQLQGYSPGSCQLSRETKDEPNNTNYHLLYSVQFVIQNEQIQSISRFSLDASVSAPNYFFNATIQRTTSKKGKYEQRAVMSVTDRSDDQKKTYVWNYTPQGRLVSSFGNIRDEIPDFVLKTMIGVSVPRQDIYDIIWRSLSDARTRGAPSDALLAMATAMVYSFGYFDYGRKAKILADSFSHEQGNRIGEALRFFGIHLPNQ